jgi:hypothetical protein
MTLPIKRVSALVLILAMLAVGPAGMCMAQARSTARTVVVELYTSQGCSSCPPADALLGELARLPNVIALAFHVDYWDSIGWRDRFSISEAVQRQSRYVDTLRLSSAFTPQVVIDGRASFVGSDRQRIVAALAVTLDTIPIEADVANGELTVTLPERRDRSGFDVNLVAYLPEASTAVGRGENSGRTLAEFNIVRQFRRLGIWDGKKSIIRVPLDSIPTEATRVAVLLQRSQQGPIAGSVVAALR